MAFGYTLVDVNGTSRALDGSLGITVRRGARGLGFPEVAPNGDKLPYAPGAALRRVSTAPGVLDVPLKLQRSTQALLETLIDDLRGWVLPGTERNEEPSTVRLRVTSAGGTTREIEGVARLDRGDDAAGWATWQLYVLTLYCQEAYWRDASATTHTFTSGTGLTTWFPYWPYNLMPSSVYAIETITNTGHIEAWPVWTITGPGTSPTLVNLTTEETLELDGLELAAGDVVTIDTSEGVRTIENQNGVNLWPFATPTSEMWPLVAGANSVQVRMADTTSESAVELSYRRRWAGGHR